MNHVDEVEVLGRADGPRGEVLLRRRGEAYELVVNGVFAMDSRETSSERALADLPVRWDGARVLVGGLGLGYTAAALLEHPLAHLDVVELEPALARWAWRGLTPVLGAVARDPRVRLHTTDVAALLAARHEERWDAVVLDVDNGPDFLIHAGNAVLYAPPGLRRAFGRLAPGGVLAVWCQGPAPALEAALRQLSPAVRAVAHHVQRDGRRWSYVVYTAVGPQ